MLTPFDVNAPILFFPVRWANSVTNWLNGLFSRSGTIDISNTPDPGEGGGCSIDVNIENLYQQLLPRLRAEFVSRNALPEALGNVTGNSVKMQNGQLEVNKQYFDDQRNYDNNVFSS